MNAKTLTDSDFTKLAKYGRILGDKTRLRILEELLHGDQCVGDLAACLRMSNSAISHQLRELRLAGLVKNRRVGKQIYYSYQNDHIRQQLIAFSASAAPATSGL